MAEHDVKVKVKETVEKTAEQLITENLDTWTTAIEQKSASGRGSSKKFSLHGIKKLRELILELAVRGKLVPQDVNDEPASLLLERIAAEKKQLVKEGKLKKQKPLPEISEDEKPFELPNGWEWSKLGALSSDIHYGYTASAKHNSEGVRLLRITDIQNDKVNWPTVPACDISPEKAQNYLLENDDILLARTGGTIGKSYLVENINVEAVFASYLIRVRRIESMYASYIKVYLGSQLYWRQLYDNAAGTGQPNVNATALKSLLFPIPPKEEQHRIVAKVDELMSLCDALEAQTEASIAAHQTLVETLLGALLLPSAQTEHTNSEDKASDATIDVSSRANNPAQISGYDHAVDNSPEPTFDNALEQSLTNSFAKDWQRVAEHFDTLFTTEASIDTLKQTILQLAVMGKLVKQDPNDEPAAKLLERLKAEKAQLIKDGKIKKQKPLPAITDEEKPFELPKGWEWENLNSLITIMDAGWSPACPPEASPNNDVWGVLKTTAVQNMEYREYENKVLAESKEPKPQYEVKVGDILITRAGPKNRVGVSCLVQETRPKLMISDKIIRFHLVEVGMSERFISLCLNAGPTAEFLESAKSGMAESQMNISQDKLKAAPIPLAPIEEQHRIVARVDDLMTLCDQLKARLSDAQTTQLHLTDAIVEQVV